jgi:acyl carrier protein
MNLEEARALVTSAALKVQKDGGRLAGRTPGSALDFSLSELDYDSMRALELCMEVEERSGIEVDLSELGSDPSLETIAALLVAKSKQAIPGTT